MAENDPSSPAPLSAKAYAEARHEAEALVETQRRLSTELGSSGIAGQQFARTLSTAFVGLAVQGKSLGDVLSSLALRLSQLALSAAFKPLEGALGSVINALLAAPAAVAPGGGIAKPASLPAGIGSSLPATSPAGLAGAAAPAAAAAPTAYLGPSIVLNVTTPDAESFRRSETQIAALLARAVGQGQRNL